MRFSERTVPQDYSDFLHQRHKKPDSPCSPRSLPRLPVSPSNERRLEPSDKSSIHTSDQETWSSSEVSAQRSSRTSLPSLNPSSYHGQNSSRSGKPGTTSKKTASLSNSSNCLTSGHIDREEIFKVVRQVQSYSAQVLKQLLCKDSEIVLLERKIKASDGKGYRMLQAQLCELQSSLSSKTTEYIKLRQLNSELRSSTKSLLEKNENLTTDLTERDDELINLKHRKEELKRRLLNQKVSKEKLNNTVKRLREQVSQLQTEAREFNADKAVKLDLRFAVEDRERELQRAYDKVEYLNSVIRKYQERNQDLEVENKKMMTKVGQQLKKPNVAPVKENSELRNKNSHLRKQRDRFRQGAMMKQRNINHKPLPKPKSFSLFGVRSGGPSFKKGGPEISNWMPFNSRVVDLAKILEPEMQDTVNTYVK